MQSVSRCRGVEKLPVNNENFAKTAWNCLIVIGQHCFQICFYSDLSSKTGVDVGSGGRGPGDADRDGGTDATNNAKDPIHQQAPKCHNIWRAASHLSSPHPLPAPQQLCEERKKHCKTQDLNCDSECRIWTSIFTTIGKHVRPSQKGC